MPKIDSSGKLGTSMDYSQFLDIKKRYKTVQRQNAKPIAGSQAIHPAFNKDQMGGGGVDNGAVDYYMVKGLGKLYINNKNIH
jgi:hypothetical protein